MKNQERAREIAAQVWCEPCFAHVVMDAPTAERIAEKIDAVAREAAEAMQERAVKTLELELTRTNKAMTMRLGKQWLQSLIYLIRTLPVTEEEHP